MQTHSSRFQKLVTEAKAEIQEIGIDAVKAGLMQDPCPFYLIDVREDHEWATGHIPQAIHLGKGVIERDIEKTVPELNTPLVLYCGGGYRSALAAESLQKMGYTQVSSLTGGFAAWRNTHGF